MNTILKTGDKVRITKFSGVPDAICQPGKMSEWKHGQEDNGFFSLPVDYYCEGYLIAPIEEGREVRLKRTNRNGHVVDGLMITSVVQKITGMTFTTLNSLYIVEELP